MAKKKKDDTNPVDPDTGLSAAEIDKLAKTSTKDEGSGSWGGKRRNSGPKGRWAGLGKTQQISIPVAALPDVISLLDELNKQCSSEGS